MPIIFDAYSVWVGKQSINIRSTRCSLHHHYITDSVHTQGHVECEGPNKRLYEFTGNIVLDQNDRKTEPIQSDQILLRGAQLRNTEWIYGLVIYSGHDSKLLQNASRAPLKRSRMDHIINQTGELVKGGS